MLNVQTQTLVSIAMSTYNGERFLRKQLDSILSQTHKNLEIVISDDCSTDKTVKIIQEYQAKDARITLYQNKENIGFVKNFEKVISLCNGEYIALSDQDDIWKINKIETFLSQIKEDVLIYSNAILIDKKSNKIEGNFITDDNNITKWKSNIPFLLNNVISGNTMMFKKELIKYILPIPEKISYHDFWIAFVAATYGTITCTKEPMIFYRRYTEQVTHSKKPKHKNYFEKLRYKKNKIILQYNKKADNLEAFKSLTLLNNQDTIDIIDSLIWHFRNHQNLYFNSDLYRILNKSSDIIFATVKPNKRRKQIIRLSIGLKLRSLTLFMI